MTVTRRLLEDMFAAMRGALGPSRWWPADSDFEVAVGAALEGIVGRRLDAGQKFQVSTSSP